MPRTFCMNDNEIKTSSLLGSIKADGSPRRGAEATRSETASQIEIEIEIANEIETKQ